MNDILNMQPGRELDALVATKVMGYTTYSDFPVHAVYTGSPTPTSFKVYQPSTDISAAWEVVEKFDEVMVRRYETVSGDHLYSCRIERWFNEFRVSSKTAPHAICLAALLALQE